jgi:hypothetical protein
MARVGLRPSACDADLLAFELVGRRDRARRHEDERIDRREHADDDQVAAPRCRAHRLGAAQLRDLDLTRQQTRNAGTGVNRVELDVQALLLEVAAIERHPFGQVVGACSAGGHLQRHLT